MAKENVGKFYDKLAQDAALAEKLNALDKEFAEKNGASTDDAAMREKAVESVVIPLAEEVGLPFTLEELKEYEQDQMKNMTLSEDELDQVAGGAIKAGGSGESESSKPVAYCAFLGFGFGKTERKGNTAYCFLLGGSDGPIGGESQ
ncbi:MAG: Nif11-like leader peptide family natural product precursor [Anaerovibrio sp.]|uniref:Nif11-like leader peptide family natural product precursor n=1 Tax=Anaerovibrio sp. TaxID=1872532 RepID=UPI001B2EFEFE|nr:Nif11-like leader peptide family natural product precursor [Anaerovibrio sp.]MBO6245393.1 Nif11-like leader peptide family natural product precursor [Anaerovibrio sp.]